MSTAMATFQFPPTGQQVRTFLRGDLPWFVTADALAVLSLNRSSVALLDDDEKGVHTVDTPGGDQQVSVINEPGLYSLILRSRRPEAKAFKRWVTHDVLPTIRRTGRYEVAPRHELPQTYAAALRELASTVEQRDAAQAALAVAEPKAEAWDVLASAHGDFSVREAAYILNRDHGIDIGQNRLFALLRQWRMVDQHDRPYASHSRHLTLRPQTRPDWTTGDRKTAKPQVRITAEGLRYIYRRLTGKNLPVVAS